MPEALLTALAACLALSQPVPQIVRLVRTRSVVGVSGPTTWLGLAINRGWAVLVPKRRWTVRVAAAAAC